MATLEQLQDALINADKAGDNEAARVLADEIVKLQGSSQHPQQTSTQLGADRRMADDAQVAEQTAVGRQEAYDQKPWYDQALQAGQDVGRLLESGASMGFADKMRAVSSPASEDGYLAKINAGLNYINPVSALGSAIASTVTGGSNAYKDNLAKEREETQAARDRARSAALPTEIAGAVMSGSTLANSGLTLAGRVNTANMPAWMGVPTRAAVLAPEGALYGAADAVGNDRDIATGAITGALAAPVGSVIADGVSTAASRILPRRAGQQIPQLQQLRADARQAYEAADNAGVIVNPQSVQRLQQNIERELVDFGYHPQLQPGIGAVLHDLDRISQGNVTLRGIDVLRRIANNARQSNTPSERAAANIIIDQIDDYVQGIRPQDLVSGNSRDGINSLLRARQLWTRVAKNERVMHAVEAADLRAASTGSGGNVENATRQNLRRLIDPNSRTAPRNWTADERAAINEIVRGTPAQNTLRLAGKLSPSGNGLMAALGIGGTMANPLVGVASLGGMAAKYVADRGVMRGVQALDELIRVGGTQQALQAARGALRQLSQAQREAVGRILQMSVIQSEVGQQQPAQ